MGNVQLSAGQIAPYANDAGFSGQARVMAVAIALAESQGNTWAVNNDGDGTQDQGLWQINTIHASQFPGMVRDPFSGGSGIASQGLSTMFNPLTNARAAYVISSGGTNWEPWTTYQTGAYRQYLTRATQAALYGPFPNNPDALNPTGSATAPASSVAGAPYVLVDDHDRPIIAVTASNALQAEASVPSAINGLMLAGFGDLGPYVTDGSVELDADQIGQVTFTVQDPDGKIAPALQLGTRAINGPQITYKGLRLRIASREISQGGGAGPQWQVTAQTAVAQQMATYRNPPTMPSGVAASSGDDTLTDTPGDDTSTMDVTAAAGTVGNAYSDGSSVPPTDFAQQTLTQNPSPNTMITPTDYIAFWVQKFGGSLYYGAPTYTQSVISPLPATQGLNPEVYGESLWDLCSRLAANYGYWLFDADGMNVWFGPPGTGQLNYENGQGIISRGLPFKVGWNGAWGDTGFDAVEFPDCRDSTNDILTPATITVKLPRNRGENVRPGMCMWLKGVPNFDGKGAGQPYVVTKVAWTMDAGQTPVTVTAVTPINPVPTDIALLPQPNPVIAGQGNQQVPYATQFPIPSNVAATHLVDYFVTLALQQQGKPYVWGAEGPSSFDCSGLVEWCAAQVGITYPGPGFGGTRSQAQYLTSAAAGKTIPVQQAATTYGALLFVGDQGSEHVAISLGDGVHTIEALNSTVGVVLDGSPGSADSIPIAQRFNLGALIPGMDYNDQPTVVPLNPAAPVVGPGGINQYGGAGAAPYGPSRG